MPGMPHAWGCEASAMKLFLLLSLVSLTTAVDAEVSPLPVAEQKEDATDSTTMEPQLFSTPSSYIAEGSADASTNQNLLNFPQEVVSTNEATTTAIEATTTAIEGTTAVKALTTDIISTSIMESTSSAGLTSTELPPFDKERGTDIEMIDFNDDFFHYDYYSLRKWGLVAAAILFILGILILTCGKHGKFPRCRGTKRTRTYDVTQA